MTERDDSFSAAGDADNRPGPSKGKVPRSFLAYLPWRDEDEVFDEAEVRAYAEQYVRQQYPDWNEEAIEETVAYFLGNDETRERIEILMMIEEWTPE